MQVREYWENRARVSCADKTATTNDVWLRELEIKTFLRILAALPAPRTLLDVGCGDGYSTLRVVSALPGVMAFGVDYSAEMIGIARKRLDDAPSVGSRLGFVVGDLLHLPLGARFDIVMTDRCLINLDSRYSQRLALEQLAKVLKPGGHYLAIENFQEGHDAMNSARAAVGLAPIPIRWHNLYLTEREFHESIAGFFQLMSIEEFSSSYYFATRVVYSKMCAMRGEEPDYDHEIHRLAIDLQQVGQFSPIRLAILRRPE